MKRVVMVLCVLMFLTLTGNFSTRVVAQKANCQWVFEKAVKWAGTAERDHSLGPALQNADAQLSRAYIEMYQACK